MKTRTLYEIRCEGCGRVELVAEVPAEFPRHHINNGYLTEPECIERREQQRARDETREVVRRAEVDALIAKCAADRILRMLAAEIGDDDDELLNDRVCQIAPRSIYDMALGSDMAEGIARRCIRAARESSEAAR